MKMRLSSCRLEFELTKYRRKTELHVLLQDVGYDKKMPCEEKSVRADVILVTLGQALTLPEPGQGVPFCTAAIYDQISDEWE